MSNVLASHEAEQIVLGSLLSQPKLLPEVAKLLNDTSFYYDKHQALYASILSLQEHGTVPDIMTVSDDLEKAKKLEYIGGSSYLAELIRKAIGFPNLLHYAGIIKNKAELRSFWEFFVKHAEDINAGTITDVSKIVEETADKILNLNTENSEKNTTLNEIAKLYTDMQEKYAERKAQGFDYLGIPTKFASLDRATDGYQKECVWGIAAFTSIGKSTFQTNLIKKLLDQDKRVCLFSLEMSKEDLFAKLLALEVEASPVEITKGLLNNEIYPKQVAAKQKYFDKKLSIYTECINFEDIILTMQSEMLKEKVDVFFLDYIQNITSKKINDQTKLVTLAAKELQKMTRKLKTTLVMLSQISNEANKTGGVLEVGGKDAGAIRAASNVFIYLKRDGTEEEILEKFKTGQDMPMKLILNKNRMGRIGSFALNLKQESGIMYEPL